jgi:hypothetical protein
MKKRYHFDIISYKVFIIELNLKSDQARVRVMVFNVTFNHISRSS